MTGPQTRDTKLEELDAAIAAGRSFEIAVPLSTLIEADPTDARAYHIGFKALSAVAAEAGEQWEALRSGSANHWAALIRILVFQKDCLERPRILHHGLASLLTSQNAETARRLVAACLPSLGAIPESDAPPGLVLFLTVARSVLPATGPTQKTVSRLHLDQFPKFSAGDLSLSYSVMFNEQHFGANRDDLLSRYPNAAAALAPDAGLGFRHLQLLDWLGIGALFAAADNSDFLGAMKARLDQAPPGSVAKEERAAARVLFLRYWRPSGRIDAKVLASLSLEPELLEHATSVTLQVAKPRETLVNGLGGRRRQALYAASNRVRMALPALARIGQKPHVALCVSGQLRGYRAALCTWKKALLPFAEFDIYIHTWSNVGRASPQPFRAFLPFEGQRFCAEWRRIGTLEGFERLQQNYPRIFSALETTAQIDADYLKALYNARDVVVEDDRDERFADYSNQDKMHYKISAAHELASRSGNSYDLMMRLRPDLALTLAGFSWDVLHNVCAETPTIFADAGYGVHYQNLMIGDQLAVGAADPMAKYAGTWNNYRATAALELANFPKSLTGHVSLAQSCWLARIDVQKLPFKRGGLLEMESLPARNILDALEEDAAGRSDANDKSLINAIKDDLEIRAKA